MINQSFKFNVISILVIGIILVSYIFTESKPDTDSKDILLVNTNPRKSIQEIEKKQTSPPTIHSQSNTLGTSSHQPKHDSNEVESADSDSSGINQGDPLLSENTGLTKSTQVAKNNANIEDIPVTPAIKVSGGANELYFEPETEMDYQAMEVVIALPNGNQLKKTFNPREVAAVFDKNLKDGIYAWETNITPKIEPSIRKEMAAVRARGNLQEEQQLIKELRDDGHIPSAQQAQDNIQSGYFSILDGKIVMPRGTEKPLH